MFVRVWFVLFLATFSYAKDSNQEWKRLRDESQTIAQVFCGQKTTVIGTINKQFAFQCKGEDSSISAYVRNGVLYTIYADRPIPTGVQKIEVINPNDDRWILFRKYFKEAVRRRTLYYVSMHQGFFH